MTDQLQPGNNMADLLSRWVEHGWIRELDRAFAAFLAQQAYDAHPLLILSAALASYQLGRGHVCLDLKATLADASHALCLPPNDSEGGEEDSKVPLPGTLLVGIDLAAWRAALRHPNLVGHGPGATPLVLAGSRLYLRRYWQYEQVVRQAIDRRLEEGSQQSTWSVEVLRHALDALFPRAADAAQADWQKIACALATRNAFSIITGGPGTGKTTTVVKLLALLQSLSLGALQWPRKLRIRLAAPTGKAAARLNESIAGAVQRLPLAGLPNAEEVRTSIPTEVTTVHRLLGSRPDTRHFRHDAGNLLPLDVLVIDEASMVDLEMMACVFSALPPRARLILLGDRDQLASVEAGAVLGELCSRAREGHYTPATCEWLQAVTGETVLPVLIDAAGHPLDQAVAMLRQSHRFTADSGIGQLAEAVNSGSVTAVREVLAVPYADLARLDLVSDEAALRRLVIDGTCTNPGDAVQERRQGDKPLLTRVGYRHYLELLRQQRPGQDAEPAAFDDWARQVLAAHGQFQVLCVVRRGRNGVEGINQRIAEMLVAEGLIPASQNWYLGRPVLVTRNDYGLGLMNGDVGITLAQPRRSCDGAVVTWILRVAFAAGDGRGGIKWVLPSRLQAVETVYAMTVHKSQGSEFTHAALVLPETVNPVLTRELVYTGISRARRWFTLANASRAQVLDVAVELRVLRTSGLCREEPDSMRPLI